MPVHEIILYYQILNSDKILWKCIKDHLLFVIRQIRIFFVSCKHSVSRTLNNSNISSDACAYPISSVYDVSNFSDILNVKFINENLNIIIAYIDDMKNFTNKRFLPDLKKYNILLRHCVDPNNFDFSDFYDCLFDFVDQSLTHILVKYQDIDEDIEEEISCKIWRVKTTDLYEMNNILDSFVMKTLA